MISLKPSHIFRQAQYDIARGQSELVEDLALVITKCLVKFK